MNKKLGLLDKRYGLKYPLRRFRSNLHYLQSVIKSAYLQKMYGMQIGKNTRISATARLDKTHPVGVHIGTNTAISFRAVILTHDFVNNIKTSTYVGDYCFIGGDVIIHPGVRVGNHCIIGAGSVVMNDIPDNSVAAGNPARVIRSGVQTGEYGVLAGDAPQNTAVLATPEARPIRKAVRKEDVLEFIKTETGMSDDELAAPVDTVGIDSFTLITLRTGLETRFDTSISDQEWISAKALGDIANLSAFSFATRQSEPATVAYASDPRSVKTQPAHSKAVDPPPPPPKIPDDRFTDTAHRLPPGKPASMVDDRSPGRIHRRHMLEMSKMALSGLGEPWLFRELNDLHWTLVTDFLQCPSSQIVDGAGDRLYATFTRCKIDFAPSLVGFNENSPLDIRSRLERYGASVFFSHHDFVGADGQAGEVSMMSTFAKYGERGNNKSLVKGAPDIPDPDSVPSMSEIAKFGFDYRKRRAEPVDDVVLFETEYEILGPHDINGVGLLYFAAYPMIFDLCLERNEERAFLQKYSTVSKDIMYFANSEPDDTLIFRLHQRDEPDVKLIRHVCSLTRKSDGVRLAEMTGVKRKVAK